MPVAPCGPGSGGVPRPGADPYAFLLYIEELTVDAIGAFSNTFLQNRDGQTYLDPGEFQEWLDDRTPVQGDGRLRNRPPIWTPDDSGLGFAAATIEDFCAYGPPTEDEISPVFSPQVRRAAALALAERWVNNCTCRTPEPTRGLCPYLYFIQFNFGASGVSVYTGQRENQFLLNGYFHFGPIRNLRFYEENDRLVYAFESHGGPFGEDATEDLRLSDPITISDFYLIQQFPGLIPESVRVYGEFVSITPVNPNLIDNCGPPIPPPPPFPTGRILNPPCPSCQPLPDPPPVIFIPTQCRFTDECKDQLKKVHDLMGPDEFPAKLPETLFDPAREGQKEYKNYAQILEWLIIQLDGLIGQFPLDINYRDIEGKKQSIKIENLSEAVAEQLGLLLNIAADAEIAVQLGFKSSTEAIRALNAATLAADYAKANGDFLGYRSKNFTSDIKLSLTPGDKTLKGALSESTKKIQRFKFDDNQDLQDFLRQLLIGVGIIKSAFYRPLDQRDLLPGEQIRQDRSPDENGLNNDDREWEEFLNQIEEPLSRRRRDENLPKPKVEDIDVRSQDSRNQTDRERRRNQSTNT